MSFYSILPLVSGVLVLSLFGLALGSVCSIIYSGLKGSGHNIGPTYGIGFGNHHPGSIILSDEERGALKAKDFKWEVFISY